MPVTISPEDRDFLDRVRALGMAGKTQDEIAAETGLTRTTLRNRLANVGFEFWPITEVRAILGKRTLPQLLETGEIAVSTPTDERRAA